MGNRAARQAQADADAARAEEQARQDRIRSGTAEVNSIFDGQFNDNFFNAQKQRYVDYAMPQVNDQRDKAAKELTFSLDRAGQLEGSTRADLSSELQKRYDLQSQKVRDDALSFSAQSRNSAEGARGDLISMLNSTGDAQGAVSSALTRSAALSQPQAYSPLANLFADFTGALGTQAAAERAYAMGGPKPTFNTGLFAPRSGSVAVTR